MISGEYWTDAKVVRLSFPARLFFIACWQLADDHGRFRWEPERIKLQVFPADAIDVCKLADELAELNLIELYFVDGREYACVPKFTDHQKIHPDRESKFPPKSAQIRPNPPSRVRARTQPNLTQPNPTEPNTPLPPASGGRRARQGVRIIEETEATALFDRAKAGEALTPEDHAAVGFCSLRSVTGRDFRDAPYILARCREGATCLDLVLVIIYFIRLVDERPEFWKQYFDATTPFRPEKFSGYLAKAKAWNDEGRPWLTPEGAARGELRRKLSLGRELPDIETRLASLQGATP